MIANKLASVSELFRNKWGLLLALCVLLLLFDITLYVADYFFGEEPGVVFSFKLLDIIVLSNSIVVGLFISLWIILSLIKRIAIIKKIAVNVLLSVASMIVALVLIEVLFSILLHLRSSDGTSWPYPVVMDDHVFRRDEVLGFSLEPNSSHHYKALLINPEAQDTTVLYDNEIVTDSSGYRKVEIPNMKQRDKYALFFGCSFTFGTGVDGDETVPYLVAKGDSGYCAYNFAVSGYSTQSMVAQLQFKNLRPLVSQDSGICFYTYIPDHLPRVIGDMRITNSFGTDLPYYDYENDKITYQGTFRNGRSITTSLYYLLGKSSFFQYYNINLPPAGLESHYIKTCDLIQQAYQEYQQQFRNDNFYVIIYPGDDTIVKYLTRYDIKVLNFAKLFDDKDKQSLFYPYDGHPTVQANALFSNHLINSISHEKFE